VCVTRIREQLGSGVVSGEPARADRDLKMSCTDASQRQLQYALEIRIKTNFFLKKLWRYYPAK
jgi:hypothetical protein